MAIKYITSSHSIIGAQEKNGKENEDSFFLVKKPVGEDMAIFAGVADGMGGLQNGKRASSFVSNSLSEWFEDSWEELRRLRPQDLADRLSEKLVQLHEVLREKEQGRAGTTLASVFVRGTTYVVGNIGDSRVYLTEGNEILQITKDQTVAQYQVDEWIVNEDELDVSDRRVHTLLQALGAAEEIIPEILIGKTKNQFTFFLCSDGMINRLQINEVKEQLNETTAQSEKEKIVNMMKLAVKRGEMDNITGVIVKKTDPDNPIDDPGEITKPSLYQEFIPDGFSGKTENLGEQDA